MTRRRRIAERNPVTGRCDEQAITRLIRVIARQTAQEMFQAFKNAPEAGGGLASGRFERTEHESNGKAAGDRPSSASQERYLSVREAAVRLSVSEKKIRRMIKAGDLRARRLGKLLRIGEQDLFPPPSVDHPEAAEDD